MIENVVDVDRFLGERTLIAEHFHAVDEIADAVGFRADQLRQRAILVGERRFEKLRRTADADSGFLISCAQHGGHARRTVRAAARCVNWRSIICAMLRCWTMSRMCPARSGNGPACTSTSLGMRKLRRVHFRRRYSFDRHSRPANLLEQRDERTAEGQQFIEGLALQHGDGR